MEPVDTEATRYSVASISCQVLLVDDDEAIRNLVAGYLESFGCSVLAAESGQQAIEIAARPDAQIDMVISDVVMPGLDGPELVRALRTRRPGIKVLYMSAYPRSNLSERGAFAESGHLLSKPFTRDALKRALTEVLSVGQSDFPEIPVTWR